MTREAFRAVVLDYPPCAPYGPEEQTCRELGGTFEVVGYERFRADPTPCDILLNACGEPLTSALLEAARPSFVVGYGVGLDWIDVAAARERGTHVVNMPLANVPDVAAHALALMLACSRHLVAADRVVRSGVFDWTRAGLPIRLAGRRVGLIAFGNIPRRLARLLAPHGADLAAYDPHVDAEVMAEHGVRRVLALDELIGSSEIVSVHAPAAAETHNLLDRRRIALLPRAAIVIVTGRGSTYDAEALAEALGDGRVAAAGLDVFPDEPLPAGHALLSSANALLTPHMAGISRESIDAQHDLAAAAIRDAAARLRMLGEG
jgi:D-3-phosphoglycerate dehydrogenase